MMIDFKKITQTDASNISYVCSRASAYRDVFIDMGEYGSTEAVELVRTILRRYGYRCKYKSEDSEMWVY